MRYPASEKLEIIRIVEKSHLPVKQTLAKLGIPRTTFYRWCDLLRLGGIDALEDHRPHPGHVWNRVPDAIRHGNWPSDSPTRSAILSQNLQCIGC
jgi:putative transposase